MCFSGALKQIACPVCRRVTDCSAGIDSLPTNRDKLYLLKIDSSHEEKDDAYVVVLSFFFYLLQLLTRNGLG